MNDEKKLLVISWNAMLHLSDKNMTLEISRNVYACACVGCPMQCWTRHGCTQGLVRGSFTYFRPLRLMLYITKKYKSIFLPWQLSGDGKLVNLAKDGDWKPKIVLPGRGLYPTVDLVSHCRIHNWRLFINSCLPSRISLRVNTERYFLPLKLWSKVMLQEL